jgi:hypothetical protein
MIKQSDPPSTGRGHGRTEQRILTAVPVADTDQIDFPGAAQIIRIVRYTGGLDGQRTTKKSSTPSPP